MASQTDITLAFMAKVLGPLPENAEQVESPSHLKQLRAEVGDVWYVAWQRAEMTYHRLLAAIHEGCMVRVAHLEPTWDRTSALEATAFDDYTTAVDAAMRIPAFNRGAAKDKAERLRRWTKGIYGIRWVDVQADYLPAWNKLVEIDHAKFGIAWKAVAK